MITVTLIKTLAELMQHLPLFLEGFREMNKRHKAFDCDERGFIKTLVGVLGSGPENGICVAFDEELAVGYGVAFEDTPPYCEEKHLLLWALYSKPEYSKLVSKAIFDSAETFAMSYDYAVLRAYNGRMNGSSIKFFEKTLGMRRNRIEFTKKLL